MSPAAIDKQYAASDFTSLDEHNAQTPATFFSLTPVLHLHCAGAKIKLAADLLRDNDAFKTLSADASSTGQDLAEISDIDVWVTSKFLALCSQATDKGCLIEYPTVSVHGLQAESVMLELKLSDQEDVPGVDIDFAPIFIIPSETSTDGGESTNGNVNGHTPKTAVDKLYQAISDCQELNPDTSMSDDEDEPASMPGEGGWITSENMQQFMDENGNLTMPSTLSDGQGLGQGAGHTRPAPESEDNEDEAKWQRTS